MTRLFAEQPVLLAIVLAIAGVACLYGWLKTGKRAAAIIGLICWALIPVGFFVAAQWETDREQITKLVHDVAAAVDVNDLQQVLEFIDPESPEIRDSVAAEMPKYTFSRASVGQIRSLTFLPATDPPEVQVDITANADLSLRAGSMAEQHVARRVVFRCLKRNDRWYVSQYTHLPPIGGHDSFTPQNELTRTYKDY